MELMVDLSQWHSQVRDRKQNTADSINKPDKSKIQRFPVLPASPWWKGKLFES